MTLVTSVEMARRTVPWERSAKGSAMAKSERFAGLGFVLAVVIGAVGGAVIWGGLNSVVINGRHVIDGFAWPFNTIFPFVVAGAIINGAAVVLSKRRSESHREELRAVAGELGLRFEDGDVEVAPEGRPRTLLCAQWSRCENRLSGMSGGSPAQMFELTTVSQKGDGSVRRNWTVIVFEQTGLPGFACFPKNWWTLADRALMSPVSFHPDEGAEATRRAVAEFDAIYQVCLGESLAGSDEEEVRNLFRAPRLLSLAQHPGWVIQSARGCLVCARRGIVPAAERGSLWREAAEVRRALAAPVSSAEPAIGAAPGMELGREGVRRVGRSGGSAAGAFAGFAVGFLVVAALTFGHRRIHPFMLAAVLPIIFGAAAAGAILGARLGGRAADRSYRRNPEAACKVRIGWGWVIAAAFAGWILGLPAGMGLVTLLQPHVPLWLMPIVFFSPGLFGMFLGGLAGQRIARLRAGV